MLLAVEAFFTCASPARLVFEAALSGKEHRDACLFASFNYFFVFDAAAWLDDDGDACSLGCVDVISGGEEGVAGHHGTLCLGAGLFQTQS